MDRSGTKGTRCGNRQIYKPGKVRKVVLHSFYRKAMAKKTLVSRRIASPDKLLVTTVSYEFMRRYKNMSRDLPTEEN